MHQDIANQISGNSKGFKGKSQCGLGREKTGSICQEPGLHNRQSDLLSSDPGEIEP
jgi:hypothetical protein